MTPPDPSIGLHDDSLKVGAKWRTDYEKWESG